MLDMADPTGTDPTADHADRLLAIAGEVREAKDAYDAARARRATAIQEIAGGEGVSYADVAKLAGVSTARVGQIVGEDRRLRYDAVQDVYCPACGAEPGTRCSSRTSLFHAERRERRKAFASGDYAKLTMPRQPGELVEFGA